jgi:M6 family metalloprotease-like protein
MFARAIILTLATFLTISNSLADGQAVPPTQSCGTLGQSQQTAIGGEWITASGTLKVMMIFIDFPDDALDPTNSTWPVGSGPNYLSNIIDVTAGQNSGINANITTYFRDMSFGQFTVIGTAHYVQAPHTLAWYEANHPNAEAGYSASDALQILDATMDFADYDGWTDYQYSHTLGSDGVVDMVFICYRQWYLNRGNFGSSFIAEGWVGGSLPFGSLSVDGGARMITGSHSLDALQMMQYPRIEHVVHEFGHHLGINHQYAPGMWSLMGHRSPSVSSFMNAVERAQLGWMTIQDVTASGVQSLGDLGTMGQAYRVSLGSGEYLILENHQGISQYDVVDASGASPGLWVLHQASNAAYPTEGTLRVMPADGRWDWANPQWVTFPGTSVSVPVLKHAAVNRTTGKSDRDFIPAVDPGGAMTYNHLLAWIPDGGSQVVFGSRNKGDGQDVFNSTNNDLISRWSSPAAATLGGVASNNAVRYLGQNETSINLQFYVGNPADAPPSKPQFLTLAIVGGVGNLHPKLTWTANVESDISTYKIYRTHGVGGNYGLLATVSHPTTSYIDYSVSPGNFDTVYYKIRAFDNTSLGSVFSYPVWMKSNHQQKLQSDPGEGEPTGTPRQYSLYPCYPNPFNPVTTVGFELPEPGRVSLIVFDAVGREVATLVDGYRESGIHRMDWNASLVASGAYFLRIGVRDVSGNVVFTRVHELLLTK